VNSGVVAWDNDGSIMTPLERPGLLVTNWNFYLGGDILVAPIVREALRPDVSFLFPFFFLFLFLFLFSSILTFVCFLQGTAQRTVDFPAGSNWVDWWNTTVVYQGGTTIDYECPLANFPVFKRFGAVIPLDAEYAGAYPFNSPQQPLTLEFTGSLASSEDKLVVIRGLDRQNLTVRVTSDRDEDEGRAVVRVDLEVDRKNGRFSRRPMILKMKVRGEETENLIKDVVLTATQGLRLPKLDFFDGEQLYKPRWNVVNGDLLVFIPTGAIGTQTPCAISIVM